VVVVDDHPLIRRGLAELIANEPGLTVCGEAADAATAWTEVERAAPELMIIDLSLKASDGLQLIKGIRARYPAIRVLVVSMHDEKLYAERALQAGATGYVQKQEPPEVVVQAIREVVAGHVYLSRAMTERLLRQAVLGAGAEPRSPVETLSDRELEILELLGEGLSTPDIARQLHLSKKTVQSHREHLKEKLQLKSAAELLRYAVARQFQRD
jgi:DNA-binding NarL/FixJ family response regulator